jgi:hypothetical protein
MSDDLTRKSWAVGLPAGVTLSRDSSGGWWISVDVDMTELSIAVREAAYAFDDSEELSDEEFAALDAFIGLVGSEVEAASVESWHPQGQA